MLIRNTSLDLTTDGTGSLVDVRIRDGVIVELGDVQHPGSDERVIDARGGSLIPGLHDHHIHLFALAAARTSVDCGPPSVVDELQLRSALQQAPGTHWIRGVGYHESVAGNLDAETLNTMVAERPVRIQHRTGKMWFLNSAAIDELGLDDNLPGIERSSDGRPSGRLFRMDAWLRERLGQSDLPDIAPISKELTDCGVTGVTDTTPSNDSATFRLFQRLVDDGRLRQRVRVMGQASLSGSASEFVRLGEVKLMLDEYALPPLSEVVAALRAAHDVGRGVAFHCVTVTELVFALGAIAEAGGLGDRIEHASVVPEQALPLLRDMGATVVTQPGLIHTRGEQYLADLSDAELAMLYRVRTLLDAGVPLGGSSDAPYGAIDPWQSMTAAVQRKTVAGRLIGSDESVTPERALGLFLGSAGDPGGPARKIAVGAIADCCLLAVPWSTARTRLRRDDVRLTIIAGEVI